MVKTWAQTLVGSGKTERGGNAKEGWNWEIQCCLLSHLCVHLEILPLDSVWLSDPTYRMECGAR